MNSCIVYLSSPQLSKLSTGQYRFDMLCKSIENTSTIFKNNDYIIFHEDLDISHQSIILDINNNCKFEKLDFIREELNFKQFGRPKGYMLMCRFFSGELQKYLIENDYESYIRFDDDSFLLEPMIKIESIEKGLKDNDYLFRTIFFDGQPKFNNGKPTQSLFEFTKDFVIKKGYNIQGLNNYLLQNRFIDNNGLYTGLCPYNNFHATNLKMWKHPLIEDYVNNILENNGCLMNFWMDANIHSMIIFILCPLAEIKVNLIMNFGYRHNRHFSILNSPNFQYKSNETFYP